MAYELNTLNDEKLLQYKSRRKKEKGKCIFSKKENN